LWLVAPKKDPLLGDVRGVHADQVRRLAAILRLSDGLDEGHSQSIRDVKLRFSKKQVLLELLHVAVLVTEALRLAEADAVDDRRVVERVADDRVLLARQGLEQAAVRVEARRYPWRLGSQADRSTGGSSRNPNIIS
jgi:hypothetical protein